MSYCDIIKNKRCKKHKEEDRKSSEQNIDKMSNSGEEVREKRKAKIAVNRESLLTNLIKQHHNQLLINNLYLLVAAHEGRLIL